jgi:hypothetical protein
MKSGMASSSMFSSISIVLPPLSPETLCREIQLQAFRDVPYIPLGAFFLAAAYRSDLTGGIPFFTNVRRT